MEKSNFDKLMQRYISGQVTKLEKAKIEAWLDVMKTEDTAQLELSKEDEEKLFRKISANLDNTKEIIGLRPTSVMHSSRWVFRVAASLLIVMAAAYGVWHVSQKYGSHQDVEKLILNDGSIVWLHGESKLSYYEKPGENSRHASLEGEALFEVAKDANRPFLITCGEMTVKVLGTSFNLKTGRDSIELKVLTGRVHVSSSADEVGVNVEPNQKIIYTTRGKSQKGQLDTRELLGIMENTEYDMQFSNIALSQVIAKIERKFDVSIHVSKHAGNCRITADFTDQSLDNTLKIISEVLDVEYTRTNNSISISGNGCQPSTE